MPWKIPRMGRLTFDFLAPKPVFNRPVNFRRKAGQVPKSVSVAFLASLLLVAITVMALKAATMNFVRENGSRGFIFTLRNSRQTTLAALPKDLYGGTARLALVATIVSVVLTMGHLGFIIREMKDKSKTQPYVLRRNLMFLHFINMILILLSMVALFVTHKSSSHFSVRYMSRKGGFGKDGFYDRGIFDLETWSCELKSIPGAQVAWDDYASQCKIEVAGRMAMVPFFLLSVVVTCLAVAQMMGYRRDIDGVQMKTADEEIEMRKFNAV